MTHCPICSKYACFKLIQTRNNTKKKIFFCKLCDFEFFNKDPSKKISKKGLDIFRLKPAGLKLPSCTDDFNNGEKQSKFYLKKYIKLNDKNSNILEIGCSWGYFLNLIKKKVKAHVYGVEIDVQKNNYVNKYLNIKCFFDIDEIVNLKIKFKKIFLFYSYQYIYQPKIFLKRLLNILDPNGKIIILTPNKNDFLKNKWNNDNYINFIYDEMTINYFSILSIKKLVKNLNLKNYKVKSLAGYSFINHLNWFIHGKPFTTGIVGGDKYIELLESYSKKNSKIKKILINFFKFSKKYKDEIEKSNLGNQIELVVCKSR
jgi:SAM-dependent methyltransferase